MDNQKKLEDLYSQMHELTKPECAGCKVPYSCCHHAYCDMAEQIAQLRNIDVEPYKTGHFTLPFMGSSGCNLPPHLRPLCTLHTCEINAFGCKRNDPQWTEKYFDLREQIEILEFELEENQKGS